MQHLKFLLLLFFIAGTRVYDYMSTRAFTPELSRESNPLVTVVGLKWTGLTIVLTLLAVYVIFALYISIYKSGGLLPKEKGLTFKQFIPYFYLGHQDKFSAVFWKMPKGFIRFNSVIGQVLAWALVWAGLLSTSMWLLIKHTNWYYPKYHNPPLLYGLLLIGIVLAAYLFLKNAYHTYLAGTRERR